MLSKSGLPNPAICAFLFCSTALLSWRTKCGLALSCEEATKKAVAYRGSSSQSLIYVARCPVDGHGSQSPRLVHDNVLDALLIAKQKVWGSAQER